MRRRLVLILLFAAMVGFVASYLVYRVTVQVQTAQTTAQVAARFDAGHYLLAQVTAFAVRHERLESRLLRQHTLTGFRGGLRSESGDTGSVQSGPACLA